MATKEARAGTPPSPPPDFRASPIERDGQEFLVMSYALPEWEMPSVLTASEREVIRALLDGSTYEEIAKARGTSPRTIANQLAGAFSKLGVGSRMQLAALLQRPPK